MNKNCAESFRLLDETESDSDIPSPPEAPRRKVKFKKRYRQASRVPTITRAGRKSCLARTCSIIETFLIVILIITVVILTVIISSLYKNVDRLQKKATDLENAAKITPDVMHNLHKQLQILERNSSAYLSDITILYYNISAYSEKMAYLKDTVETMSKSIASAPEIRKIPENIQTLTQSIATLNSRISTLELTIKDVRETQQRLEEETSMLEDNSTYFKASIQELFNITPIDKPELANIHERLDAQSKLLSHFNKSIHSSLFPKLDILKENLQLLTHNYDEVHEFSDYLYHNLTEQVYKNVLYINELQEVLNQIPMDAKNITGKEEPFPILHQIVHLYVTLVKKVMPYQDIETLLENSNSTKFINELLAKHQSKMHDPDLETTSTASPLTLKPTLKMFRP